MPDIENVRQPPSQGNIDQRPESTGGMVTFREYLARESDLLWDAHHREHDAITKALERAQQAMEHRLEGMNEFRAQLSDQVSTFMTREQIGEREKTIDLAVTQLREQVNLLDRWRAVMEGRLWALSVGFTIVTIAINVVARYLFH